jgi:hypothetical protein
MGVVKCIEVGRPLLQAPAIVPRIATAPEQPIGKGQIDSQALVAHLPKALGQAREERAVRTLQKENDFAGVHGFNNVGRGRQRIGKKVSSLL